MDVEYSPFDHATHQDPFPVYARLLAEAPVYHSERDDFWALTRHADVSAALQDSARFSSSHGPLLDVPPWGPDAPRALSFVAMDPPRHTALRALVSRGFTARRVAALEPHIRGIARRHLAEALRRDGGAFDFVEDFAIRVPLDVVSELIGVPGSDRDGVRRLAEASLQREDDGTGRISQRGLDAGAELAAYWARLIAERRRAPAEDLLSVLCEELDDQEIIPMLFVLLSAGSETTTNLLGHAWYWAWRNPDQRERAYADAGAWVEETLRYDPPAIGLARLLTEDIELHGVPIPAGARMWLLIAAANRDPRVFPDPDRYDLTRDTSRMISFGGGRHFCMGSALGRLEARVALQELAAAVADYEIDPAGARRSHIGNVRGFATLPTVVKPR
ncbi:hypothetical protein HNP84_001573 [Thermocatellispora tengchongensis]|uniref:Cytochrome P450 n=1 Tax=Thermocatellispora tengchongensis TaxID=1073253 RepID=A0A840P310_9ACTN|nr:cytochrome P450 [Thermocatellispora tengchongensis]MBB5131860.1 hypothetical protein [Thermocatellispora tengchongensis]